MNQKYYEAYEERYKTVHAKGIRWSSEVNTPIVLQVIEKYHIHKNQKILEIGCGEGRDSKAVLENGYQLMAADLSQEAIEFCKRTMPEYQERFSVLDCLSNDMTQQFDFVYAVVSK